MFFPIDAEEWSKALGRIRRLRHSRNWKRIGSSDIYWDATFLAVLIDTVDSLLLEEPEQAFELSSQGILLAERMRAESCPGGSELGKRSLGAWINAVHGSSCRALERYTESEAAFQNALGLTSKKVLHWAAAEVWRRYAALLLYQGSLAGLDFVNKALGGYAGFPAAQADALVLRGLFHQFLEKDFSAAALDTGKALELVETRRSSREARTWLIAMNNLSVIYVYGTSDLSTIETTLKRLRQASEKLSRHEPFRRMICLWIQALLLAPLGVSRKAARLLTKSSNWMFRNRHYQSASLCAVDLARILLDSGEPEAALSVVEGLAGAVEGAEPRFRYFLEDHLARVRSVQLSEESLATFREALALFTHSRRKRDQPLGTVDGYISSIGGSVEAGAEPPAPSTG